MRRTGDRLAFRAILGWGLILPVASLVAFDVAIGEASRGTGGFEAAWLAIVGFFVVPGMLLANCWLFFVRWSRRARVFLAGLVLPTLMGGAEAALMHGSRGFDRWANSVSVQLPWLRWAFLAVFFLPLLTLALRSLARGRASGSSLPGNARKA